VTNAVQDELGVIELASKLIKIPSVNGEEGRLGTFLAGWLAEAGLQVQTEEVAPGRWNVLAIQRPAGPGDGQELGLLFHAHMDTVPAHGMNHPFSGHVEDGYIWGRGAVDQKGGLAAAVAALVALARRGRAPAVPVGLIAVVDEESEHRGSVALAQSGLRAKQAIVTEPSGLRVVVGCKGTVPLRVRVRGKAAHGCRPWLGVNAIEKAMQVARSMLAQRFPEVELPGLSRARGSINLGVLQGGAAYNIVPDRCELWFDRRTVPGESQAEVLAEVRALIDELAVQDPSLQAEVEIARPDWDWDPIASRGLKPTLVPPDSGLPEWVAEHHTRIVGIEPERYFTDGYNEMDFLVNDMAIPTVQYGPGDSSLCHTDEERLDVSQLVTCARVYLSLLEDAASASSNVA
jgi:succinyl-diaminopimelate desuccinylase